MLSKRRELQGLELTALAVRCQQAGDNPADLREKAYELKNEWAQFAERDASPPTAKEKQQIEKEKEALKKRMIDFLASD